MREEIKKFFGGITPLLIFFMIQIFCDLVSCKNQVELRERLDKLEREFDQQIAIMNSEKKNSPADSEGDSSVYKGDSAFNMFTSTVSMDSVKMDSIKMIYGIKK